MKDMLNVFLYKNLSSPPYIFKYIHTYLESKPQPSSVLSVVFCFSVCGASLQDAAQGACLLVFTLSLPAVFQGWTR